MKAPVVASAQPWPSASKSWWWTSAHCRWPCTVSVRGLQAADLEQRRLDAVALHREAAGEVEVAGRRVELVGLEDADFSKKLRSLCVLTYVGDCDRAVDRERRRLDMGDAQCASTCRSPLMLTSLALTRATKAYPDERHGLPPRLRCRFLRGERGSATVAVDLQLSAPVRGCTAACGRRQARAPPEIFATMAYRDGDEKRTCPMPASLAFQLPSLAASPRAHHRDQVLPTYHPQGSACVLRPNATRRGRRRPRRHRATPH